MITGIIDPDPIAVFNIEDGSYVFEIDEPGYYSISIHGAGFILEKHPILINLISDKGEELKVNKLILSPRFKRKGKIGIERWGFSTEDTGSFKISFSNLNDVRAKESMLASKRYFESPVRKNQLQIIMYKSVAPVRRLLYILSCILAFIILFTAIAIISMGWN